PTGNARAISFRHPPIVRMTNTYIANGRGPFADLIRDLKLGVYACGAFGGQTMLENFSFTAAYGHMIRDGQVAELVKDVVLAGNLFQTLDRIDHIAGDFRWNQMGGCCGKGGQFPLPVTEEAGVNVRVLHRGRVGVAGTTAVGGDGVAAQHAAPLLDRALASAELGEEIALAFPAPAKLPRVATHGARAADASLARLIEIGSFLLERLAREGCQVNVAIEREVADTRVANTAGAHGSYRTTGVAGSADVGRIAGDRVA